MVAENVGSMYHSLNLLADTFSPHKEKVEGLIFCIMASCLASIEMVHKFC